MDIKPTNNALINKIVNAPKGSYVLLYSPSCGFSQKALELLRSHNLSYKGYDIDQMGGLERVLSTLKTGQGATGFDPAHRTRPIIFINGHFLGGADQLERLLQL